LQKGKKGDLFDEGEGSDIKGDKESSKRGERRGTGPPSKVSL